MLNGDEIGVVMYHILIHVILMLKIGWSMIMACNLTCMEVWIGVLGEIVAETAICIIMQISGFALSVELLSPR